MATGKRITELGTEASLDDADLMLIGSNGSSSLTKTTLGTLKKWLFGGNALDRYYPIGSIYMSVNDINPNTQFGGTWEKITGRMLIGASSAYALGTTGGSAEVTLATDQIPSHTHTGPSHTHSGPSHTHAVPAHTHAMAHTHGIPQLTGSALSSGSEHEHCGHYNSDGGSGSKNRYLPSGTKESTTPLTLKDGAHAHTVKTNASTTGGASTANTGNSSQFNTGASGTGVTGASGTGATGATGGGKAHSNMPPYLAVNIWKRVA